jgi:putative redox protein
MVEGHRSEKLAALIMAGSHQILSDVKAKIGGGDLGPDPHELLEAALSACTIITLQMYADRHQWPLASADVLVQVESEGKESVLRREIRLRGPLDETQTQRLMEIADRCPIHRLLVSKVSIRTELRAD